MKLYPFEIDNSLKLMDLVSFKPGTFYKFFLVIRKKDGSPIADYLTTTKKEKIIKYWIIESKEAFDKYFPEMNFFCQTFPGSRLYLVLDRKDTKKSLRRLRDRSIEELDCCVDGGKPLTGRAVNRIHSSITSEPETTDRSAMKYMLDVDIKDFEKYDEFLFDLKNLLKGLGFEEDAMVVLETKNGKHIILQRKFDPNKLGVLCSRYDFVEYKTNAAGLILMSKISM